MLQWWRWTFDPEIHNTNVLTSDSTNLRSSKYWLRLNLLLSAGPNSGSKNATPFPGSSSSATRVSGGKSSKQSSNILETTNLNLESLSSRYICYVSVSTSNRVLIVLCLIITYLYVYFKPLTNNKFSFFADFLLRNQIL